MLPHILYRPPTGCQEFLEERSFELKIILCLWVNWSITFSSINGEKYSCWQVKKCELVTVAFHFMIEMCHRLASSCCPLSVPVKWYLLTCQCLLAANAMLATTKHCFALSTAEHWAMLGTEHYWALLAKLGNSKFCISDAVQSFARPNPKLSVQRNSNPKNIVDCRKLKLTFWYRTLWNRLGQLYFEHWCLVINADFSHTLPSQSQSSNCFIE